VSGLKTGEVLLMRANGFLELLDVLGSPLPEGGLGLTVPLLPLLRRCVYLKSKLAWDEASGAGCMR
jgi:hypothetical protein